MSLTVDPHGRLLAGDEGGWIYRIRPSPLGGDERETSVAPIPLEIGAAQGLLCALGSLYVVVNKGRDAGPQAGLYRLRDTRGDDEYDTVEQLVALDGFGEHGPHAVILSADEQSLLVSCGNHTELPDVTMSRVPRCWGEDQLLPRMWDALGHAVGKLAPGGFILRVHPDGQEVELLSSGYRNQYDIALNADGELFTFDADMEWDIGAPWYRPTRICHATSGSEFGWRSGSAKWSSHYEDSLPSVVDIGPGSPTGITFGYGARFPARYQRALFACDWSYGVLYAVHLEPAGASYTGAVEKFAMASPLAITDLVVNPRDGALYLTVGGRGSQSALVRIRYTGDELTQPVDYRNPVGKDARDLRRRLESAHGETARLGVEEIVPHLADADRYIRFAARVALEHSPVTAWSEMALSGEDWPGQLTALLALARVGDAAQRRAAIRRVLDVPWNGLTRQQRLRYLRVLTVALARLTPPNESWEMSDDWDDEGEFAADEDRNTANSPPQAARDAGARSANRGAPPTAVDPQMRGTLRKVLDPLYPSGDPDIDRELCRLLVYLEAPRVAARSLDLMEAAPTQEEQIQYAVELRLLATGWSLEDRRRYLEWFIRVAATRGGMSFQGFLKAMRQAAIATLDDEERGELAPLLDTKIVPREPHFELSQRDYVRDWQVNELMTKIPPDVGATNLEPGREVFARANCFRCHRVGGEGGIVGPDLTGVGRRYNVRDLLTSIIEPNQEISDQYRQTVFVTDERVVIGRVVNVSLSQLMVNTDMLDPSELVVLRREDIVEQFPSPVSTMPAGLLNTFREEEIRDLVAFLRSVAAAPQ